MSDLPDDAFTDVNLDINPSDAAIAAAAEAEGKVAPEGDKGDKEPEAKEPADKGGDEGGDGGEDGDTPPAADGDDALRDKQEKPKGGFQGRIDALTARYRDAERRAATAEAQLTAQNSSDKGAPPERPTPDQFDDYGKYVEALTDWKVDQHARESVGSTAKEAGEEAAAIRGQIWSTKVDAVKTSIPDWDEVVGKSEVLLRADIVNAMMEADRGPELLNHLARNPDVVDTLNEMSSARAAMELERIQSSFEKAAEPKGDAPAPVAKPSKAPAPIDPVRPGGSQKVPLDKIDDMDEYVARRRSQGATWA